MGIFFFFLGGGSFGRGGGGETQDPLLSWVLPYQCFNRFLVPAPYTTSDYWHLNHLIVSTAGRSCFSRWCSCCFVAGWVFCLFVCLTSQSVRQKGDPFPCQRQCPADAGSFRNQSPREVQLARGIHFDNLRSTQNCTGSLKSWHMLIGFSRIISMTSLKQESN